MKPRYLVVKLIARLPDRLLVSPAPGVEVIIPDTEAGLGMLAAIVWERQDKLRNRDRA